jgi:hypothetical protein
MLRVNSIARIGKPAVEPIAHIEFADGPLRPVYEADGRQFVVTEGGERVYGVWYIPPDGDPRPLIVEADEPAEDF